ncbi:hypothetical protein D3C84_945410 [compost metagenome]
MGDNVWTFQFGQEHIQHVTETRSGVAYAVRNMQPAFVRLDRGGALAVLDFLDRMVVALIDDRFLLNNGILNRLRQPPADAAA